MTTRAKICFLRDGRARPDLDFAERVGIGPVTEARAIVHRQIPWNGYSSMLMDEGRPVNLRIENSQPEQSPLIQRLWSPRAKDGPAKFPQHPEQPLIPRPGRIVGGLLLRINDLGLRHQSCA